MDMRIEKVRNKTDIKRFINLSDRLYEGDEKYTPYMKGDLAKTLSRLILKEKSYSALIAYDTEGKASGRVLFTVDKNKQLDTEKCGFFSLYECADDPDLAQALLTKMKEQLEEMGAEYISGTFSPFDPDNRRGIMVKGFDEAPLIFTSYNHPYYSGQLEEFGMEKNVDTYQYKVTFEDKVFDRLRRLSERTAERSGVRIDTVDFSNVERDIKDYCIVMKTATTEINYQQAPSEEEITKIFKEWKSFLDPELILIARRKSDDAPVGIAMALPDYFELFRRMKGRLDPRGIFVLLTGKKKIKSARAMLQYVIPEYQNQGVIGMLAYDMFSSARRRGFSHLEAGTILENNAASISTMNFLRAELTRIYRIYSMKL